MQILSTMSMPIGKVNATNKSASHVKKQSPVQNLLLMKVHFIQTEQNGSKVVGIRMTNKSLLPKKQFIYSIRKLKLYLQFHQSLGSSYSHMP
jgi:hypothetical protein